MTAPPFTSNPRATGVVARSSKVYEGSLKLGDTTTAQMDFSCLPTAISITPPDTPSASDTGEVLCGDPVEAEPSGRNANAYGTLTFTSLQDFDDPAGLIAYSWSHMGDFVPYEWLTNPTGPTITGTVQVWPLPVGGDVGRAQRLTADAAWNLGELPTFSWSTARTSAATPTPDTTDTAATL